MDTGKSSNNVMELYKCIVLTIIAIVLIGIYFRIPQIVTIEDLVSEKAKPEKVPAVRVIGSVNAKVEK